MKIIFIAVCFCFLANNCAAQNKTADSLLTELGNANGDAARIGIMNKILYEVNTLSQQERIDYSKKILDLAKEQHDKVLKAVITAELGYIIAINGNNLQGTELVYRALDIAQELKSKEALGIVYIDLAICFKKDPVKHTQYLFLALGNSEAAGDNYNLGAVFLHLSRYYSAIQIQDSALYYAQRCYELSLSKKIDQNLSYSLIQLAKVHYYNLNNKGIAFEYIRKALDTKFGMENGDMFVLANINFAHLFQSEANTDSVLFYTNKAYAKMDKARFVYSLDVYDLYKNAYEKLNSDSALKYYKLYEKVKDSIDNLSDVQQQQILSIKKDLEFEQQALQRKQNIQYALLALGIITFVILFLVLSRRHITNTRVIQFLGIVALLVVFEFLNLLLHPFLERITHHNPILMLLALVCIAALLVPLHHRLEKWATHKLVEKNKQIRLAAAKKTIEQLENDNS